MNHASTHLSRASVMAAWMAILSGLFALPAGASAFWLMAPPDEMLRSGEPIVLEIVRPALPAEWPETFRLRLEQNNRSWEVVLSAVGPKVENDVRRTYRGAMPARITGLIRGELVGLESNRLALLVREPDVIEQMMTPDDGEAAAARHSERTLSMLVSADEGALSANDPMYFVIGKGGGARFQFSFKYRVFDPDSRPVGWFSPLANLHFGYTQTSMWDLGGESRPFRDSSYRPSLFWQGATFGDGLRPDMVQGGFEHESNGKDGAASRSINIFFVRPTWVNRFSDGHFFVFFPKLYVYQDKTDNPDIQCYRGYADWELGYGRVDGTALRAIFRSGTAGYGSAQFEISYPLRNPLFARTGGFVFLQVFKGYGETLLDYNRNSSTQMRLGFAIVR